jgi:hypothetical protein
MEDSKFPATPPSPSPAQPADSAGNFNNANATAAVASFSGDNVSQPGIVETTTQTAVTVHLKRRQSSSSSGGEQKSDRPEKKPSSLPTKQLSELLSATNAFDCEPDVASATVQDKLEKSVVTLQKDRALELWENVVRKSVDIDGTVAVDVAEKLKMGLVPPIFHAYCARAAGHATENAGVSVKGIADDDSDESARQNLATHRSAQNEAGDEPGNRDRASLDEELIDGDSFFDGTNVRLKIRDSDLKEVWTFSEPWTKIVRKLLCTDAKMVGADVEVTEVDSDFNLGKVKNSSDAHLITRRLSRGVVAECLNMAPGDTVAIVGNPGIGKSWTLIYALQQLLLQEGACVLFFMAKRGRALACIRRNNEVYVWKAGMTKANSDLFDCENVWVLLDPEEARSESTKFVTGKRRLLYAASNNKAHFVTDATKKDARLLHYLSPFDDEEMRAAVPIMTGKEKFDEIVFDWASKVGNLPRWLLTKVQFEGRLRDVDAAAGALSPELVKKILESDGISDGQVNLPGTVFALSAYREGNEDIDAPVQIGYDGEVGVIYTKPSLSLMNGYVFDKVAGKNREKVLSYWCAISNSERSKMGEAVENLVWLDLQGGCSFRTWSMKNQKHVEPPNLADISRVRTDCTMEDLSTVFNHGNELVRMAPGTALIDFAGPGRRVYQVTVSADHSMSVAGLQKLLEAAGYMKRTGKKYEMVVDPLLLKLD